ncbi:ubiquinol-cytochrome c reductase complex assembly factor 6 sloth 2 [Colletes latitarsis]|uniref:ubiquinol-cytochrome c reductase complex assembly factor 6 sloth 2 n=1 Tax=Colletes latitarsis TaxID=2605962 RepID=UPI00403725F1
MPAGVSSFRFISFSTLSILSMMAGAQWVHVIYRPLDDLDDLIEQAVKEKLTKT